MPNFELEKIAKTLDQFQFPKKITIEVTAECNLECAMCHYSSMRRPKGVMPFELWRRCADEIAQVSPETECWFSGSGEPLLQPELLSQMISYGKSVGLKAQYLNTNGMLLTPEVADLVLDSGVDLVVFGVDGYTPVTYSAIRVGGIRDELYSNIEGFVAARRARAFGPEIQVQFIEMDENEHEMEDFKNYWLSKGVVVKVRRKLSWGGRIETPATVPDEERIPCPWAITLMHVLWDGRVARCAGDTEGEECVGNAWHESLSELWSRLGSYRQLQLDHRFDEVPERCRQCKDWMTGASERTNPAQNPPEIPVPPPRNREE